MGAHGLRGTETLGFSLRGSGHQRGCKLKARGCVRMRWSTIAAETSDGTGVISNCGVLSLDKMS